MINMPV